MPRLYPSGLARSRGPSRSWRRSARSSKPRRTGCARTSPRAESEIAARLGDAVGDAGDDSADAGAKTFQREHELALTENARELLAQTERVLAKIDDGSYGVCESCGEPIGKARLQAFPRATLCVACKQREERR